MTTGMRPAAWTLRTGHPDLCPGEGQDVAARPPLCTARCPVCLEWMTAHAFPASPGGARIGRHYRPSLLDEAS